MNDEDVLTVMWIIAAIIMLSFFISWMNFDNKYDNELALKYCGLTKYSSLNNILLGDMACYKLDNNVNRTFVFCEYQTTSFGRPKEETTKCYERPEENKYIKEGFTYAKEIEKR